MDHQGDSDNWPVHVRFALWKHSVVFIALVFPHPGMKIYFGGLKMSTKALWYVIPLFALIVGYRYMDISRWNLNKARPYSRITGNLKQVT